MTPEQEAHLAGIKNVANAILDVKYRGGVKEHGGNLWELTPKQKVWEAIKEAADQMCYLIDAYNQME